LAASVIAILVHRNKRQLGKILGDIRYVVPPPKLVGGTGNVPPVSAPMIASVPSPTRSGNVTTS